MRLIVIDWLFIFELVSHKFIRGSVSLQNFRTDWIFNKVLDWRQQLWFQNLIVYNLLPRWHISGRNLPLIFFFFEKSIYAIIVCDGFWMIPLVNLEELFSHFLVLWKFKSLCWFVGAGRHVDIVSLCWHLNNFCHLCHFSAGLIKH